MHTFTDDALIVKPKRNHINAGYSYTFYTSAILSTKDKKLDLNIGVGYSGKQVFMAKYGIFSFPFFLFPRRDSFAIKEVEMIGRYVTVPMRISYSLAKKKSVVQVRLGAELIPNFLVSKKSSITYDTAYFKPTASGA